MEIFKFRSSGEWMSALPVFLLLLTVVLAGNGEQVHARLLNVGELLWHDYFMLRADMPVPDCNPDPDVETELEKLKAEADNLDGLGELFDDAPFDREAALISLQSSRQLCIDKHRLAEQNRARITPAVIVFRTLETSIAGISLWAFEKQRMILILMLFICAVTCTIKQRHIAFKPVITILDHRMSTAAQFLGNVTLLLSAWVYRNSIYQSATVVDHPEIYLLLILGFAVLSAVNLFQLIRPRHFEKAGDSIMLAMLTIPL